MQSLAEEEEEEEEGGGGAGGAAEHMPGEEPRAAAGAPSSPVRPDRSRCKGEVAAVAAVAVAAVEGQEHS